MTRALYNAMLAEAAIEIRHRLGLASDETVETAIVLGTGWGDAFPLEATRTANMAEIAAFQGLEEMVGHKRRFEIGTVEVSAPKRPTLRPRTPRSGATLNIPTETRRVIVLRGRIHMNEGTLNPSVLLKVRLQIDVLIEMGVTKFLLTAAVGSLREDLLPGSIVIIDRFISFGQDQMPNYPGEFVSIDNAMNRAMVANLNFPHVSHVFFCGPHFESGDDKAEMARRGADVVGMSVKPEVFTVAVARVFGGHPDVSVLALGYVSNGMDEQMDDEKHRQRALKDAPQLAEAIMQALTRWTD
ncbi:MAG: putative 6-oxopurine nucleoside phosphorylase [Candidatus Uhrbacteria bacterium GW2011_GWA2_52_8d]|uniref:purine-nucleoside phosphorylase n=1 Tax=Candidatus Uhrbacteria bacterium GW2011_GWA2_52_8d TaxID=1618979 RepID=A0A0G2AHY6_9BACT|nr:MAG: putative 6-oxopurine nucleoside phosphorylase [Candidatus Uhrbacteria bacterium GW2011_GWA2_52_8d]